MFLGITDIGTYIIGAILITLLPGPNSLFVVSTAAQGGARHGSRAAAGVLLGDTVLITLSAAGAPLLDSLAPLFNGVKLLGACYLALTGLGMFHEAWRSWRTRPSDVAAGRRVPGEPAASSAKGGAGAAGHAAGDRAFASAFTSVVRGNPFFKALAVSVLNPKMIMFYVSFFVQFVDPSSGAPALSFLILGAIIQAFSAVYLTLLVLSGGYLTARFQRHRALAAGLTSGVGALFVGFGLKLLTAGIG